MRASAMSIKTSIHVHKENSVHLLGASTVVVRWRCHPQDEPDAGPDKELEKGNSMCKPSTVFCDS